MTHDDETEADTRANRIDPVLREAGWGVVEGSQIRRELLCPGRIQATGGRGRELPCDYVLLHKGRKLAAIEAKRAGLSHLEGITQAKDYAQRLRTRFAYATNGLKWHRINMETGEEGEFDGKFPTPDELYAATFGDAPNNWRERFDAIPFEQAGGKWEPRYYQDNAITATLDAISKGRTRILLTLATGTGKTSIAFQIAWKLFQAQWNLGGEPNRRPRILFLADRNILANQAFNDFSAFPDGALLRIDPKAIADKGGNMPRNANVFFSIFQTFMKDDGTVYTQYKPDFFDFIIIDECHRGGADDQSTWRGILEYFAPAVQLGMTATPKRSHNADTYDYFGEPVYTYSLRQGIEDGYLTPFKVRQISSNFDDYQYHPEDIVLLGVIDEGKTYPEDEMNRRIVIHERELARVEKYLGEVNQQEKAVVFCATQDHALLICSMINKKKKSTNVDYCHRVTADEGERGEQHLRDFQDNDRTIPTVLTTSRKLSTGVDARNIRHIVLLRPIKSMIEFKQIIGRGTRIFEGKNFFTIWDFVKAHEHFNDPEWDGEPLPPEGEPRPRPPEEPPEPGPEGGDPPDPEPVEIIQVKLSDERSVSIRFVDETTYWDASGKPISAAEFVELIFGQLSNMVPDEATLREIWKDPQKREQFLTQLQEAGYGAGELENLRQLVAGSETDIFDVLAHVLYSLPPITRSTRAFPVVTHGLDDQDEAMRKFLIHVLDGYVKNGEKELGEDKLSASIRSKYGTTTDGVKVLGETPRIKAAYLELQKRLYAA